MIGRYLASENRDPWIAVPLRDVAEDLVVGAVFLDDIEDVLDGRGGAYLRWNDGRTGNRRAGAREQVVVVRRVGNGLPRPGLDVVLQVRQRNHADAAALQALH